MNDFTREELEMLRHHDNMTDALHIKIQSMIDNYCEHDWKKRYDVSEYDECLKCGACEL